MTIKDIGTILTTIPKSITAKELLIGAGLGAAKFGLAAALMSKRKNKLRNALIFGALGGALGGYGSILARNLRTTWAGHWKEDPDYYDPVKLKQFLKDNKITNPTIYITGADTAKPGGLLAPAPRVDGDEAAFMFRWGDKDKILKVLNELGSEYKFNVVAHSAGGGTALNVVKNTKSKLGNVHLLDPVDFNAWAALARMLGINPYKLDFNKFDKLLTHLPTNIDTRNFGFKPLKGMSDYWVVNNPLALGRRIIGDAEILDSANHSALETGMRLDVSHNLDKFFDAVNS